MVKDKQEVVGAAAPIDLAVALESACWDLDFLTELMRTFFAAAADYVRTVAADESELAPITPADPAAVSDASEEGG
eukprot:CAMPEP_0172192244 /NCGR_PEP_ID=MMETSP1050-20130122/24207_1 /TAXON_ID=233186 /ORGANISM="Cryptomonas curvata, Strain CCAP979/52" /LENGTH=75 /DNA_ID=CAMNT_0012867499 /DNA_START=286 /DNA_END=510 /DNA_ORIENTATION=-